MAIVSNPRKQFNFSIQIAEAPIQPFLCQEVDLPEITIESTAHGDTNHDIKTGGRAVIGNATIQKIMTTSGADNYFYDWALLVADTVLGGGLPPDQYKRTVIISELAEDGVSVINTWVLTGCWPTRINGQKLNRLSSDNSIENVELSVDKPEKL